MPKKAVSAGGVITKNMDGEISVLLLRDTRFPEWYIGKGHVETGESLEQAALREASEEVGLRNVTIHHLLGTYERFVPKANEQKTIYYFLMSTEGNETPTPPENPYVELRWFPINSLPLMYLPEQQDVIEKNRDAIQTFLLS